MATVSHSKTEWTVALSLPSALFFFLLFLLFHSFVTVNTQDMLNRLLGNQIFLHLFLHLTIWNYRIDENCSAIKKEITH